MAAGVGRQSSTVINNHSFNCRVAGISFLFPTSPRQVNAQGGVTGCCGLSSHWLEMPCGAEDLSEIWVLGLVTRSRTELPVPPASLTGTQHPCSMLNGSLQHVIPRMISSTCVTCIRMVVCKEECRGVSTVGCMGDNPEGETPFQPGRGPEW